MSKNQILPAALATMFLTLEVSIARAQEVLIHLDGTTSEYLAPIANLGDIDSDGVEDFILGAPGGARVRVYSGSTFALLYAIQGPDSCCEGFGRSVGGAGDFDDDGVPDLVVGDTQDSTVTFWAGAVHVYGGTSGEELAVMYGDFDTERLGRNVAGVGDVNGDGFADVGATSLGNHVRIYGGPDGHLLRSHFGPPPYPDYAYPWIAAVGDMDGDGAADYVIGWPRDSTTGSHAGRATVYSGRTGAVIHHVFGQTGAGGGLNGDHLGVCVVGVGDIDGDAIPDFAAGASGLECLGICGGATQAMVRVYSGLDATILFEWKGIEHTNQPYGGGFGFRLFGGGDINADGTPDILVAAPYDGSTSRGSLQAFSGSTGEKLWRILGEESLGRLHEGAILGDLNGDGLAEFAVGATVAHYGGDYSGRVTMYEGFPADVAESCNTSVAFARGSMLLDIAGPIGISNNSLQFYTNDAAPSGIALFFYGAPRPRLPLDGGWLCTGPPLYLLAPPFAVDPTGHVELQLDFTLPPLLDGPSAVVPGSTWSFQLFCRDPSPTSSGPRLSDGLAITFPP